MDRTVLEHLDLTIHIIEGQLETDVFAKDIPIYISRKSCHPPFIFSAVAQSVALRLRTNCSLDRFLSPRIEEYSRYLMASDYSRKEVEKVMGDCKKLDRSELIKTNKKRRQESRKYVLCSKWDPRQPNIKEGLKLLEDVMYLNTENKKAFPQGSIICGFRRQKNIGEYIAPSKPKRVAGVAGGTGGGGGCFPCDAPRSCILHQAGSLQATTKVQSRFDGVWHKINKRITCETPNLIYYILCPCANPTDYIGSTMDVKRRWSKHKTDIRQGNWNASGLTKHFGSHHTADMEDAISNLQVTLVDHWVGDLEERGLKKLEDRWMVNMGCGTRSTRE